MRAVWSANPNSASSTATFTRDASVQRETRFEYDVFGNLKKTTYPDNSFATAMYDDFDRKIAETDAVNQTTNFEYDVQNRLKAVVQPGVVNPATGLTVQPRTEYGYDAFGNQVTIKDALTHVTTFGFDAHNRQTTRTLPLVTGEPTPTESMAYNGRGDLDFTVDFKGQKADYVYDYELTGDTRLGLLRRVDYYNTGATTPTETVGYTYDPFGRRDVVTETLGGSSRITDTDYDGEGRVTRVLNADGEIHYGYNLLGQQTQMWTGSSTTFSGGATGVEYEYDVFERLVLVREVRRDNATLSTPVESDYQFDYAGALKSVAVSQGTTTLRQTDYTYDSSHGWLTQMTNRTTSGGSVLSNFVYTRRADGQITRDFEEVLQPGNSLATTKVDYTYDALNRLVDESLDGSFESKEYVLDLVGNRVKNVTTDENNAVERTESTYDARDRLLHEQLFNAATGGTLTDTINYGYDADGSLTIRQTTSGSKTEQSWALRNRMSGATVSTWNGTIWVVQTTASYQLINDNYISPVH